MLSSGVRSPWAPAFQETSLNANPHIFLSVCSFLLIDMGLIGNEAKEETDCVLSYGQVDVLWGQPIKLIQVVSTSEFHEY